MAGSLEKMVAGRLGREWLYIETIMAGSASRTLFLRFSLGSNLFHTICVRVLLITNYF